MTDSRLVTWDESACVRMHEAALSILSDPGVDIHHEGARAMLVSAGARVDGVRVRFGVELVERALAAAPQRFELKSRGGLEPLAIEDGHVYFGTGGDCLYTHDLDTGERRRARLSDVSAFAALTERLPNLDYVMSMALPVDVPETDIDMTVVAELLRSTRKPIMICATCAPETLADLRGMAELCGDADSLIIYAMPSPPLAIAEDAAGRVIACAELGLPLVYSSSPAPGTSAPCSRAGMVAVSTADVLAGLVIHQVARPGAPFVYGALHTGLSMRTSALTYCNPETMALQQASTEMGRHYGLPTFTFGGCSDAKTLDGQWALETATTLALAALSGGTLMHDVGYVEASFQGSYESIILGDELAGYVRAYLRGVSLDDLDFVVDEIRTAGPGGNHLARPYTRKQHRTFWQPSVLDWWMHDHWEAQGEQTLVDRLREKGCELRTQPSAFELPPDVLAELASRAGQ